MKKCVYCAADMDEGAKFCQNCGKEQPSGSESSYVFTNEVNPLHDERLSFFERLLHSVRDVITKPTQFYSSYPKKADISQAFVFYLLIMIVVTFFIFLWNSIIPSDTTQIAEILQKIGMSDEQVAQFSQTQSKSILENILGAFGGYVFYVIALFVGAGITHLLVLLFGEDKHGFTATFNAAALAVPPMLCAVIPQIGTFVGGVWMLVMQIFALKHIQEISWEKQFLSFYFRYYYAVCAAESLRFLVLVPHLVCNKQ